MKIQKSGQILNLFLNRSEMPLDFGYSRLRNITNQGSGPGSEFEHLGEMLLPGEIC